MEPTQHDVHVPSRSTARGPGDPRRGRGRRGGTGDRGQRGEVRAIARAAGRTCCRPGCETPAAATLVFSYKEQVARLVDLLEQGEPQAYDLCPAHADRTRPPVGWELSDTRPPPSDAPRRLEDDETVAVLAAALRGETPPTRVSVVEGGRTDDADTDGIPGADSSEASTGDVAAEQPVDEDPLRAALEELQRVAMPDDGLPGGATATPLRPDAPDAPDAPVDEPAHEPVDEPARAVWEEVESARAASGETPGGGDDDLTLW